MPLRSPPRHATRRSSQSLALALALRFGAAAPIAAAQSAATNAHNVLAVATQAAADGSSASNPVDLHSVDVTAMGTPMLASPKYTAPLLDTPQTIQVIGSDLMRKQGVTTLTEALRDSPGVGTFYVGENGSTSTGDAVQMRGFDTSSSIFVDGVRDLGSISRDIFNIDHIEVTKGPAGTDNGRTAPSGAINLVTKQPELRDHLGASISYGSGDQKRAAADWNQVLSEANGSAMRLNVMDQRSGMPGRDDVANNRWGIAPSLAVGLGSPTRIFLDYLHIRQDNTPDGGVPTIGLPGYTSPDPDRPLPGEAEPVDSGNFYGTNADHDNVDVDMLTLRVEHEINDHMALRNTTRWGRTGQDYLLSSFMSAADYFHAPDLADPSTWTIRRLPNFKNQTNRIITNRTNLSAQFDTGSISHSLSTGAEVTQERVHTKDIAALGDGSWPDVSLYHPDPDPDAGPLNYGDTGARGSGTTDTLAAYVFDTMTFNEHWQVTAGARLDHYRTHFNDTVPCGGRRAPACGSLPDASIVPELDARVNGNLPSWKVGIVFKPAANGSVYINFADARQPPGGDTLELSSSEKSPDNPGFAPQKASTIESGTKWNVLNEHLLLTAALYRTTVSNQVTQDPVDQTYYQIGEKRVEGVELGAVGKITPNWAINAGYTRMNADVIKGDRVSEDGSDDLSYTPDSAFTAWTTYRLPFNLTVGGGVRYSGGLKRGTDGAVGTPEYTKSWWVANAFLSYPVSEHLNLQLNVYNLFGTDYVAAINKSGYRYTPGVPRSATLTASLSF